MRALEGQRLDKAAAAGALQEAKLKPLTIMTIHWRQLQKCEGALGSFQSDCAIYHGEQDSADSATSPRKFANLFGTARHKMWHKIYTGLLLVGHPLEQLREARLAGRGARKQK
jgi:hypothetical protein